MYRAQIRVTCRPGVLDPQAEAVHAALGRLGFEGIGRTNVGKWIEIDIDGDDEAEAKRMVDEMCVKLLAHPVVEHYSFTLAPVDGEGSTA